ncbi:polysaccharide lyase family 1 protein [Stipitochalara longipes BDJ]|nr:polysaccharide lyase family 1 protein [Stipitochalara longipes BDJ]
MANLAMAAPTPTVAEGVHFAEVAKHASITDAATGYASENGGTAAVSGTDKKVVIVDGAITQAADQVKLGPDVCSLVKSMSNVVIRNIAISKVLAENGDAIEIQKSTNVWIDHVDASSDQNHDKDFYDGLLDLTHAADYVTISNSYIHDHWKASLVGHSDSNSAEDTGHLRVTYSHNYWSNINSRGPLIRFGTGHIFDNYYENVSDGINTRDGAQVLVESNTFVGGKKPLYGTDSGFAVANDNEFGDGENAAEVGTLTTVPYEYSLLGSTSVKAAVVDKA